MAERDLIAQKILGTDPQVGFGESAVLPYRRHTLDTTGFEAMERAQARRASREEARKKNNEDYYNTAIKNLPEYEKEFDRELGNWRNEIIQKSSQKIREGGSPSTSPEFAKELLSYTQAAKNTKQLKKDLENNEPLGKYVNREAYQGAKLKNYERAAERVNQGDRNALNESILPPPNDPEFFMFDAYLYDKYHNRPDTVTSEEKVSYGGQGERILGNKVIARFVTKDKSGKVVPGIDKAVVDQDLYSDTTDPDTLGYRNALFSLAEKQILNKALELKSSGDQRYKDMGTAQVATMISTNPRDPYFNEFNKNKIAEDIHRNKLEAFQRVSTESDIKAGHKYDDGTGSSDDFRIDPAIISQNSASGFPITSPGVILTKKDKPLTLNIAPKDIHDFGKGLIDPNNKDRVNVTASGLGYALQRKSDNQYGKKGTLVSFNNADEMINYINTASKKDLNSLQLKQFVFGNIQEKGDISGDTGYDKAGKKKESTENRSVAIEYDQNGETGALLNAYSEGAFGNRKLTAVEQAVKDAWDGRMQKDDRPKVVVQNGITYKLNPQTGEYE